MKKLILILFIFVTCLALCSCYPSRWFMVGTQGIATYNRYTGQFEVLWEYTEHQQKVIHDTVYVDSCVIR